MAINKLDHPSATIFVYLYKSLFVNLLFLLMYLFIQRLYTLNNNPLTKIKHDTTLCDKVCL